MNVSTILEIVCVASCLIHAVVDIFRNFKLKKQLDVLCLKCGSSLTKEEFQNHECQLTDNQLNILYDFVKSVKEVK